VQENKEKDRLLAKMASELTPKEISSMYSLYLDAKNIQEFKS
jgi:hypothetical protein